jgi:hypothetical protein
MTKITITLPDERARKIAEAAAHTGVKVEEWLEKKVEAMLTENEPPSPCTQKRTLNRGKRGMEALEELWAALPKDFVPPTDEEVQKLLEERRLRKLS